MTRKFYEKKAEAVEHEKYYGTKDPLLKYLKNQRLKHVKLAVKNFAKKTEIIDVGCGDGNVTEHYHKLVKKVTGLDLSKKRIQRAKKRKMKNFTGKTGSMTKILFKKNTFDAVLACSSLDHVQNPIKAVKEMERIVKKGGFVLIELDNDILPLHKGIRINKPMLDKLGHFNRIHYRKLKKIISNTNLKEIKVYSWGSPFRFYYRLIRYLPFLRPLLNIVGKIFPSISYEYLAVFRK